jgi:hypothetical protein
LADALRKTRAARKCVVQIDLCLAAVAAGSSECRPIFGLEFIRF